VSKTRTLEFTIPEPPEEAEALLAGRWSMTLAQMGYAPEGGGVANARLFKAREWPALVIVLCVILFPFGMLSLLWGKNVYLLSVELWPVEEASDRGGTEVCVSGSAPRKHWRVLQTWDVKPPEPSHAEEKV
jgi:hypothetical protein